MAGDNGGPMYSKPAVKRVAAWRTRECFSRAAPPREGARLKRHKGERLRAAMKAGGVVVLLARKPSPFHREARKLETAKPMPTPWKSGSVTVRCSRRPPRRVMALIQAEKATGRRFQVARKQTAPLASE